MLRPRRRWWTRSFPSRTSSTRRCSARTTCRATVSVSGADAFHPWAAPSRRVYVTGGRRRGRRIGAVATLAVRQALVAEVPPGTFSTSALRGTGGSIEFRVRRRRPRLRIALTKRAGASGRGVVDAGPKRTLCPVRADRLILEHAVPVDVARGRRAHCGDGRGVEGSRSSDGNRVQTGTHSTCSSVKTRFDVLTVRLLRRRPGCLRAVEGLYRLAGRGLHPPVGGRGHGPRGVK